jgi:hypothetical protein
MASTEHAAAASAAGQRRLTVPALAWPGWPSAVSGLAACGILLGLASQAGGYFPEATLKAGAAAFAVLALVIAIGPRFALSDSALLAVAALGGLAAWTGISSRWSATPDTAIEDFQRTLTYLGIFGLALCAAGSGRFSRHLVWMALGVMMVVLAAGLGSRLLPGLFGPQQPDAFADYRLSYPLSYWNAFGALGAMAVVLATGLASDRRSRPAVRALATSAAVVAGTAAYLSFSRGAWLAFFAGMAVLLVVAPHRLHLLISAAVICAGLALVLGRLRGLDGLTESAVAGDGQAADGRALLAVLLVAAAAAGAVQAAMAGTLRTLESQHRLRTTARRAALGVLAAAAVVAVGAYAMSATRVESDAASGLDSTTGWVSRQWTDFMTPGSFAARGSERLTTTKGTRSDLYRVAVDGFQANPLVGDGSGAFQVRFAHDRRVTEKVRDAHSLYLETVSELGLVGGLLLAAFIGSIAWAGWYARSRPRALRRSQSAAVCAAVAVWIVHAGMDWDWQVPALTGTALVLAAALFPVGVARRRGRGSSTGGTQ